MHNWKYMYVVLENGAVEECVLVPSYITDTLWTPIIAQYTILIGQHFIVLQPNKSLLTS